MTRPISRPVLAAAAACVVLLTGCSSLEGTGDKGYISDDGQVRIIDAAERTAAVEVTGTSLTGEPVDSADYLGKVLVVNTWWSGCAPCRTEMPMLSRAASELRGQASFLGINIRDASAEQGRAFMAGVGASYPSIWDPKGQAVLAFSGHASLRAIPTTIVLDDQGRVAAVISGEVPSEQTLLDVVDEISPDTADG